VGELDREDGAGGLSAEGLRKEYPTPGEPLVILNGISLRLQPGDGLAVVGPSGSGKSTLLHILGALDPPTAGTVRLGGIDPYALPEGEQADFRNRRIGFIFQDHHLLPQLTLLENVLLPLLVRAERAPAEELARARELLARVGLSTREDHRPAELSGGERQRGAVARALIGRPALVLADEPTGNLDRKSAAEVGSLLLELARSETCILIAVTHSAEMAGRFSRRMELEEGRLRELRGP